MNTAPIHRAEAGIGEQGLVTDIITRAFADDPLLNWIALQDGRRMRRIGRLVNTSVELFMPLGETFIGADGKGCALWVKPSAPAFPLWQTARVLAMLGMVAGFRRLPEMMEFYRQFESLAPPEPAYHLFYLAVLPEARRQGMGSALLQPILEKCDAERIPAYLENSNSANLKLYERHGFRLTRQWRIADNGPSIWCMYRSPQ
jgi:ribosomal protein S18 acetylase RimI-like enzyme